MYKYVHVYTSILLLTCIVTPGLTFICYQIDHSTTRIDIQYLARKAAVIMFSFSIILPALLREHLCTSAFIKAKSTHILPAYCGVQELEYPFPLFPPFFLQICRQRATSLLPERSEQQRSQNTPNQAIYSHFLIKTCCGLDLNFINHNHTIVS